MNKTDFVKIVDCVNLGRSLCPKLHYQLSCVSRVQCTPPEMGSLYIKQLLTVGNNSFGM